MDSLNLHIGGVQPHPDWKILDIEARPNVDFVCDASDLSQFPDNSIAKIYASHVLEHFYHTLNDELLNVLKEWRRVLKPGGQLLVSVPDLKTLCWLYLDPNLTESNRILIMRIMYGGHSNQYDVHKVGLDIDSLGAFATKAGFSDLKRVEKFDIFEDSSNFRIKETLVSLNAIITK